MTLSELIGLLQQYEKENGHKVVYFKDIWFGALKLSTLIVEIPSRELDKIIIFEIKNAPTPLGTGLVPKP